MLRKLLIALTLLVLFASSSVASELSITVPPYYEIRSMRLSYADLDRNDRKLENDYRLFGIIKEAIENTWKSRNGQVVIKNGLSLNSSTSNSGDLEWNEYDISIFIQVRRRLGKLLYVFDNTCEKGGTRTEAIDFDLVDESSFYSEMKRQAIRFAKGCPN